MNKNNFPSYDALSHSLIKIINEKSFGESEKINLFEILFTENSEENIFKNPNL